VGEVSLFPALTNKALEIPEESDYSIAYDDKKNLLIQARRSEFESTIRKPGEKQYHQLLIWGISVEGLKVVFESVLKCYILGKITPSRQGTCLWVFHDVSSRDKQPAETQGKSSAGL